MQYVLDCMCLVKLDEIKLMSAFCRLLIKKKKRKERKKPSPALTLSEQAQS